MSITTADLQAYAVAISALIAAGTFVANSVSSFRRSREYEVWRWQRVVISEIFQNSPRKTYSFDELSEKYKAASVKYKKRSLSDNDLSDDALRSILVNLVSSAVVCQTKDGGYRLYISRDFSETSPEEEFQPLLEAITNIADPSRFSDFLATAVGGKDPEEKTMPVLEVVMRDEVAKTNEIRSNIVNLVYEHNGRLSPVELAVKLHERGLGKVDALVSRIITFSASGNGLVLKEGKLHILNEEREEN